MVSNQNLSQTKTTTRFVDYSRMRIEKEMGAGSSEMEVEEIDKADEERHRE